MVKGFCTTVSVLVMNPHFRMVVPVRPPPVKY